MAAESSKGRLGDSQPITGKGIVGDAKKDPLREKSWDYEERRYSRIDGPRNIERGGGNVQISHSTAKHFDQPSLELPTENNDRDLPPPGYDHEYDNRKPWTRYPVGYPRFAAFIAHDEDRSTTIFRRFQRLSTRDILYLESELAYLEEEQDRLDQESRKDHELTLSMKSWNLLCLQATPPREEPKGETEEERQRRLQLEAAAQERLHLTFRIREVLRVYHKSLKRESEVLALDKPQPRPLKGTRKLFHTKFNKRTKTGSSDGATMIAGAMKTHLDPENEPDLCVLAPPVEQDRLTVLLEGPFSYFFRTKNEDGLSDYVSHHRVSVAVTIISAILATIFLIGAILGLYWVTNPNAKLGMLSGLTVAFAGSLALFTNARRQDVFAATAAYAAVLVVFVSGNLATGPTSASSPTQAAVAVPSTTATLLITSSVLATASSSILSLTPTPTSSPATSSTGLSTGAKIGIGIGIPLGVISSLVASYLAFSSWRESKKSKGQYV